MMFTGQFNRRLTIDLPADTYATLKGLAHYTGQRVSGMGAAAIEGYLNRETAISVLVGHARHNYRETLKAL